MKIKPIMFAAICLLAACKKDNNGQQAIVTFNLNGTAKTFDIYTSALSTYDTLGVQEKILSMASPGVFAGPALNTGVIVAINQNIVLPGISTLKTGNYMDPGFDTSCTSSTYNAGCNAFYFTYYDATIGSVNQSLTDSTGALYLTSFSLSPNLVSGTFRCQVADQNGNLYQITNGTFTNVPFVNQ